MNLKKFGLDRIEECIKLVKVAKNKKQAIKILENFKKTIEEKVRNKDMKIKKYCDNCGEKIVGMAVEVNFSYPSKKDGDAWHFCSDKCFCTYLSKITEEEK